MEVKKKKLNCLYNLDFSSFFGLLFGDFLDDSNSDGLFHISDGESSEGWVLGEGLNAHWLGWVHNDDGGLVLLDELWLSLDGLTSSSVDLVNEGGELAGNMGSVAIKDWRVSSRDLTRMVEDNDLGVERSTSLRRIVLGITTDVTTSDFLNGNVLDVESDVVTGKTLNELLVVHLDGLDFSGDTSGGEGDDHTGLDDTGLDTADRYSSDTTDLVNILEGKTEGLVGRSDRGLNGINGLKEGLALDNTSLGLLLPSLVPGAVGGNLNHVITVPTRDGNEGNSLGVVTDLLDEVGGLLDDLVETILRPLNGVHLVDGNNELLNTEGESKKGVLTSLTILGDTSLELTNTTGNDENSTISLGSTSNHVLDEITVTGSINNGDVVLGSLELPESDINGDTTFTLSLQLVKNPGVLEGTLSELGSFLLELLNSSLVDTTALVDQVSSGSGLTRIDVSNDDEVNMSLFLSHCE